MLDHSSDLFARRFTCEHERPMGLGAKQCLVMILLEQKAKKIKDEIFTNISKENCRLSRQNENQTCFSPPQNHLGVLQILM